MTEPLVPLTQEERDRVAAAVSARQRTALSFTGIAALATAGFGLRYLPRALRYHNLTAILMLVGVLAVVLALVWFFGWKPLLNLKADLRAGKKVIKRVKLNVLDQQANAYGETITWVHVVDGAGMHDKLLDKTGAFAGMASGSEIEVEALPKSRFALSARRL